MYLFAGSLSFDGRRTSYARSGDIEEPFDLDIPNVHERPPDADPELFFIGGYQYDGSLVYLGADGAVSRCTRTSAAPLQEWRSLGAFLEAEFERLANLYDDDGRLLHGRRSAPPRP